MAFRLRNIWIPFESKAEMPFIFIVKTSGRFIQISGCESIILNK